MTFWFLNQLFESKAQNEARERKAERKRLEKLKRKRIAQKKRDLEMDRIRDTGGLLSSSSVNEVNADNNPYTFDKGQKKEVATNLNASMGRGFGGPSDVKTGYKHSAQRLSQPGEYTRGESKLGDKTFGVTDAVSSKMRRPF